MIADQPHSSEKSSLNGWVKPPRKRQVTLAKIQNRLHQVSKGIYHRWKYKGDHPKTIVFILGCQRSGTTLMNEIFERDWETKVYPEVSKLSSQDPPRHLRLNPLPQVKAVLDQDRAPLIILKPLVESQNALKLLDYFPGSKVLWVYRDYRDVAASHVKKWSGNNSIRDLKAIVEARPNNWRYENVPDTIRTIVQEHFAEDMHPYDAAALYWFVRNHLFLDLRLETHQDVLLCQYEALSSHPVKIMKNIYGFLNQKFPGEAIVREVRTTSIKKGRDIPLSPTLDRLCQSLLEQLKTVQLYREER